MKSEKEQLTTAPEWIAQIAGDGELTPAQKAQLSDWLRESPRNVRDFLELTLLSQDVNALPFTREQVDAWVNEARETKATEISISRTGYGDTASGGTSSLSRKPWTWAAAASIAGTMLLTGAYLHWQDGRYATGFGEQKILTLTDGSVVTLNTSSQLRVDYSDDKRSLRLLKGEAFFRVARDTTRPFEVTVQSATVKALGTQFNVRIAPLGAVVSVIDGRVAVSSSPQPRLTLGKGEEARIDGQGVIAPGQISSAGKPERTAAVRAAAWTRGRVEFEATPLAEVLSEFQRYREFNVDIAGPLRQLKLTGSFDARDPESAFAYIATLPGVVVEKPSPQTYLVRQK